MAAIQSCKLIAKMRSTGLLSDDVTDIEIWASVVGDMTFSSSMRKYATDSTQLRTVGRTTRAKTISKQKIDKTQNESVVEYPSAPPPSPVSESKEYVKTSGIKWGEMIIGC